jgi:uncharacterized membrane protein YqjE
MATGYGGRGPAETPLGAIIGDLVGNLQDLVRGELRLARTELREEAQAAGVGVGLLAGAGALALVGLFFVGLTLTYALIRVVPDWAAAVIVAALFLVSAFALFAIGKQRLQQVSPVPRQTLASLKEDTEWVKQQIGADSRS